MINGRQLIYTVSCNLQLHYVQHIETRDTALHLQKSSLQISNSTNQTVEVIEEGERGIEGANSTPRWQPDSRPSCPTYLWKKTHFLVLSRTRCFPLPLPLPPLPVVVSWLDDDAPIPSA